MIHELGSILKQVEKYYEQFYVKKFDNLEEMDKFPDTGCQNGLKKK